MSFHKYNIWIVLLISASLSFLAFAGDFSKDRLNQPDRPTTSELRSYSSSSLDEALGVTPPDTPVEKLGFKVYEQVVKNILKDHSNSRIFLMARDGIPIYDALRASLEGTPVGDAVLKNVHILNLSRINCAENYAASKSGTDLEIRNYLETQGLGMDYLLSGGRALLIDGQGRGSIYRRMLKALVSGVPSGDPQRVKKLAQVLGGFDGRMVIAYGGDNRSDIIRGLSPGISESDIKNRMGSVTFPSILTDDQAKRLGVPMGNYQWGVQHLERASHWNGRAAKFGDEGRTIAEYENYPTGIERPKSIIYQRKLLRFFDGSAVRKSVLGAACLGGILKEIGD